MLKVGFAEVDITPPLGIEMSWLYPSRKRAGVLLPRLAVGVAWIIAFGSAVPMPIRPSLSTVKALARLLALPMPTSKTGSLVTQVDMDPPPTL